MNIIAKAPTDTLSEWRVELCRSGFQSLVRKISLARFFRKREGSFYGRFLNKMRSGRVLYRGWQKWRLYPWQERWLLVEAVACLGLVRLAVCVLPFRLVVLYLKDVDPAARKGRLETWTEEAAHVGWAIRVAASFTWWNSNCLAQALAGKLMLRRRTIPSTLYLGVAKGDGASKRLSAHAWLRCKTQYITGAAGQEGFKVIAVFADSD